MEYDTESGGSTVRNPDIDFTSLEFERWLSAYTSRSRDQGLCGTGVPPADEK